MKDRESQVDRDVLFIERVSKAMTGFFDVSSGPQRRKTNYSLLPVLYTAILRLETSGTWMVSELAGDRASKEKAEQCQRFVTSSLTFLRERFLALRLKKLLSRFKRTAVLLSLLLTSRRLVPVGVHFSYASAAFHRTRSLGGAYPAQHAPTVPEAVPWGSHLLLARIWELAENQNY